MVGAVNAPDNNAFEMHDVEGESVYMREALRAFNDHMAAVKRELQVKINEPESSEATIQLSSLLLLGGRVVIAKS